jgi:hypothetical protein
MWHFWQGDGCRSGLYKCCKVPMELRLSRVVTAADEARQDNTQPLATTYSQTLFGMVHRTDLARAPQHNRSCATSTAAAVQRVLHAQAAASAVPQQSHTRPAASLDNCSAELVAKHSIPTSSAEAAVNTAPERTPFTTCSAQHDAHATLTCQLLC